MRCCIFDIETTELEATGAGIFLCGSILPVVGCKQGKVKTFRIDKYDYKYDENYGYFERQENDLIRRFTEELDEYEVLIGHNIERFDIPYLRSRSYQHGLAWHTIPLVYDTVKAFRRVGFLTKLNGFGKPSASMAMVADFLGKTQRKTGVYPTAWWQSIWGSKEKRTEAMDELVFHNIEDVKENADIYLDLMNNDVRARLYRKL